MRWIVAGLLVVVAAWGAYVVSPYYALYRLGRAVESGDEAGVAARVNGRALRYSLARQVAAELATMEPASGIASADAHLAAGAALVFADPLLDGVSQPEGLIRLLRRAPHSGASGTVFGNRSVGIEDIDEFLASSHWRGFRTVYVLLPPGEPRETRYRLQLRLGNWRWRVVSIDLPPGRVREIAAGLRQRPPR